VTGNRVELMALIAETGGLRHTPAGIPALQMKLRHASEQLEAGRRRKVECEMAVQTFGEVAERLAGLPLSSQILAVGFLDRAGARNPQPVLHVTEFELIQE
jgi:primosomal replication protein N